MGSDADDLQSSPAEEKELAHAKSSSKWEAIATAVQQDLPVWAITWQDMSG